MASLKPARKAALYGLLTALAFIFAYVESLIPLNLGVPGVKLGLANLVVLAALYLLDLKGAFTVAVVRIVLTGLTFGGLFSMLYSLAGGLLSFAVMALLSRKSRLGTVGVSLCGGVAHNAGQLLVAMAVLETGTVWYYLPVLILSGTAAGVAVGLLGGIAVERLRRAFAHFSG